MSRSTTYDPELEKVKEAERSELDHIEDTLGEQIAEVDSYYKDQSDAIGKWGEEQKAQQNAQNQFTVNTINQQREQANKDYIKEQSGAYVDWQKQSNAYGASAEAMASSGLSGSGYSESSQVAMYNTYQNRVASARESYNRAVLNYDNAIKEAQLHNSSILAEIAYNTLQNQLALSLQGFQYKNNLILEKANARRQIQSLYQSKYMDVLNQINTENARKEQIRQFDESLKFDKEKFTREMALANKEYQLKRQSLLNPVEPSGFVIPNYEGELTESDLKKLNINDLTSIYLKNKDSLTDYASVKAFKEQFNLRPNDPLLTEAEWQIQYNKGFTNDSTYKKYLQNQIIYAIKNRS
jgi:hypothetical protein